METELIGFKDTFVLKSRKDVDKECECVHASYAQSL